MHTDFLIIGGGIIGLATARALRKRHPSASITLIDKEPDVARHASGRNSGVLHAGFYYSSDSLKAKFCRDGNLAMHDYCREHKLALNPCQKLVVAREPHEVEGFKGAKNTRRCKPRARRAYRRASGRRDRTQRPHLRDGAALAHHRLG